MDENIEPKYIYYAAFMAMISIYILVRWLHICKIKKIALVHEHHSNAKDDSEKKTHSTTKPSVDDNGCNIDTTTHLIPKEYAHQNEAKVSRFKKYSPPIADALISSAPSVIDLNNIDWDVFEATRHSASQTIDLNNWSNLKEYLDEHYFDVSNPSGFMNRFIGYVGEIKAKGFYEQMGHDVVLADLSNQPGYDMYVDDIPINVKTGGTQTIYNHFHKYPDIAVATGPEQSSILGDNDMVIGLPILERTGLEDATNNTFDMIDNDFNAGGPTIPTVTAIISGYRELKLLIKGHTDITSSLKNTGLDIAGTWLGGWTGSKLGFSLGTPFGPAGIVIGGVAGAISGVVLGRYLTNGMKKKPFKNAVENYNQTIQSAESLMKTKEDELFRLLSKKVETEKSRHTKAFDRLNALINQDIQKINDWSITHCNNFIDSFAELIPEIEKSLQSKKIQELNKIQCSSLFVHLLWPSLNDIKYKLIKESFKNRKSQIRYIRKVATKRNSNITEIDIIILIRDFMLDYPEDIKRVEKICMKLNKFNLTAKQKHSQVFESAKSVANRINIYSQMEIQKATHKAYNEIEEMITQLNNNIINAKKLLEREAQKIGINTDNAISQ